MATKKELKRQIEHLERENKELYAIRDKLVEKIKYIEDRLSSPPEGCTMGKECKVCMFGKYIHATTSRSGFYESIWICGKEGLCKNFVLNPEYTEGKPNDN